MAAGLQRILVGYDLRSGGDDALALAGRLAGPGAEVVLGGILPQDHLAPGFSSPWHGDAGALSRRLAAAADATGARALTESSASPAAGLEDLAEGIDAEVIVIGSPGRRAAGSVMLGTTARGLLSDAPSAVALAPGGFAGDAAPLEQLVVGYDGSPASRYALAAACELAGGVGAGVRALQVASSLHTVRPEGQDHDGVGVPVDLMTGDPASVLVREALGAGRLLALGSRRPGDETRSGLGSTAADALALARGPVVVFPRASRARRPAPPRVAAA